MHTVPTNLVLLQDLLFVSNILKIIIVLTQGQQQSAKVHSWLQLHLESGWLGLRLSGSLWASGTDFFNKIVG